MNLFSGRFGDPEKKRQRKFDKARWRLEDLKHDKQKWGFADTPSERRRRDEEIDAAKAEMNRWSA